MSLKRVVFDVRGLPQSQIEDLYLRIEQLSFITNRTVKYQSGTTDIIAFFDENLHWEEFLTLPLECSYSID